MEVKPSSRIARPIVQRKLAVGRAFAVQEGWTFHLVTEKELFQGPLLDNVRLLNRYRQGRMDEISWNNSCFRCPQVGSSLPDCSVVVTRGERSHDRLNRYADELLGHVAISWLMRAGRTDGMG